MLSKPPSAGTRRTPVPERVDGVAGDWFVGDVPAGTEELELMLAKSPSVVYDIETPDEFVHPLCGPLDDPDRKLTTAHYGG